MTAEWMTPDPWEEHGEATKRGLARTPEERLLHRRNYSRDYQRARRFGVDAPIVGWLHELACTGNHRGNKRCKPQPFYEVGE